VLLVALSFLAVSTQAQERGVRLVQNEASRRVDVFVDGQPFTSYLWPEKLKVPVLYPLRTAQGTIVTRGFPLDPRTGRARGSPSSRRAWLNYGNVNGVDFWNNSVTLPPEQQGKMGTIVHRRIVRATGGTNRGELECRDGLGDARRSTDFARGHPGSSFTRGRTCARWIGSPH